MPDPVAIPTDTAYGALLAEHYDRKYPLADGPERGYWLRNGRSEAGPILELACGTGRVLIPLVEAGLDVSGIDNSRAMLARLERRAAERGLRADVHLQSMQAFELARRYAMIFVASCTLGLIIEDDELTATFERVREHLRPGGLFLAEIEMLPDVRIKRDGDGVWRGGTQVLADGTRLVTRQTFAYDAVTHVQENTLILEKFEGPRLLASELNHLKMRFYAPEDIIGRLRDVGFVDTTASAWLGAGTSVGAVSVVSLSARTPK